MIRPIIKLLNTSVFCNEKQFNSAYALVSDERKRKIDAFSYEADKRLSLGAGVLLEEGLKELGTDDFSICYGEHKKPYLKDNDNLFFNLSHSGDYCVCAFCESEIGIDIQKIKDAKDALIKKVCTQKEQDYLLSLNKEKRNIEFTRLWTVKESYVKYLGKGLSHSLKKCEITFGEKITLTYDGILANVTFEEKDIEGYIIMVCY